MQHKLEKPHPNFNNCPLNLYFFLVHLGASSESQPATYTPCIHIFLPSPNLVIQFEKNTKKSLEELTTCR